MSAKRTMHAVALGFRALKGGSVVVGVAADKGEPRVVLSSFLATAAAGDRLTLEPYHVAAEMKRDPNGAPSARAAAAVAEARKRQEALASAGLNDIVRTLKKADCEPVAAALLVNRAGWISDLLTYSLAWPDHPPVAEGLAVRDALRFAIAKLRIEVAERDEKSLLEVAARELGLGTGAIEARLKDLGATVAKPWRKEQKLACLAAWATIAARGR